MHNKPRPHRRRALRSMQLHRRATASTPTAAPPPSCPSTVLQASMQARLVECFGSPTTDKVLLAAAGGMGGGGSASLVYFPVVLLLQAPLNRIPAGEWASSRFHRLFPSHHHPSPSHSTPHPAHGIHPSQPPKHAFHTHGVYGAHTHPQPARVWGSPDRSDRPAGLYEAYAAVFDQMWPSDPGSGQKLQRLLEVMVAAQEPPPMSLLAGLGLQVRAPEAQTYRGPYDS